jgi:hypothetical protein
VSRIAAAIVSAVLIGGVAGAAFAARTGGVIGFVVANPLDTSVTLSESKVNVGDRITLTARAKNLGSGALRPVMLTVRFDPSGFAFRDGATRKIPILPRAGRAQVSWDVCALAAGRYVVLVTATGRDTAHRTFVSESSAALLKVKPGSGTCDSAEDQIRRLIDKTLAYLGRPPLGAAPLAELKTALKALVAGRNRGTCDPLERYIKLVRAGPRTFTRTQAAELVERAATILATLGCRPKHERPLPPERSTIRGSAP